MQGVIPCPAYLVMITETRYKKFSWTKWGDRRGLLMENLPQWRCQICGDEHTRGLPSYFIPETELEHEYMRLCSYCFHNALVIEVGTFDSLLQLKVANMLTLPSKY